MVISVIHVLDIFYLLTWNGYTGYFELLVSYQIYMTLFGSCQPYLQQQPSLLFPSKLPAISADIFHNWLYVTLYSLQTIFLLK
jgi:hypothetical protein